MRKQIQALLLLCGIYPMVCSSQLSVGGPGVDPTRFRVTRFASGLNFPYSMHQLADGSILVATSKPLSEGGSLFNSTGEIVRLVDADFDGIADGPGSVLISGLPPTLTALRGAGNLLLAGAFGHGILFLGTGPTPADPLTLLGSINLRYSPGWLHANIALAMRETAGLPGHYDVFFNVGSVSNDRPTTQPVIASGLLTASLNGDSIYKFTVDLSEPTPAVSSLVQVASGLRNAAGMAFESKTGDLYLVDNGIDGASGGNEPFSVDELNRIAAEDVGVKVIDFGFADTYTLYRTGVEVGNRGVRPLATFQPIPDPQGSESEGPAEITFAPSGFPEGLNRGIFIGFHGKNRLVGLANEENPVVYHDLETGEYFHFIGNDLPGIGHLDTLLATDNSLFLADLSSAGHLVDSGTGVIWQITVSPLSVTTVSAASFDVEGAVAPDSIASVFGPGLATRNENASTQPLPTLLAGISVGVTDTTGTERTAGLISVSPTQLNFLVPADTATGPATVSVSRDGEVIGGGDVQIEPVAPALFSANATGQGVAAGLYLRVAADGSRTEDLMFDPETRTAVPIDLGAEQDQIFLLLFGTGIRGASSSQVGVTVGGESVPVLAAQAQSEFAGLDQVNVGPLPRTLAGRGEIDIHLAAAGRTANTVTVRIAE